MLRRLLLVCAVLVAAQYLPALVRYAVAVSALPGQVVAVQGVAVTRRAVLDAADEY